MAKQVIVVVHGVGVKESGISSDLLAAALQDPDGQTADTRLPPHSSDDFLLLEASEYDKSNKASTFPARIRRYRSYDKGVVKEERVIADFFWGDVTAFGTGAVNVVLAYFKVAMGLSHAIRENAREVFPNEDRWTDRFIGNCARGAALTIHGPIIALNVVLLGGLLLAAAIKVAATSIVAAAKLPPETLTQGLGADILLRVQIVLVAAVAIAAALFLLKRGGSFLYRHLLSWVILSGLVFLVLALPELSGGAISVKRIDAALTSFQCSVHEADANLLDKCKRAYSDLFKVGVRMVAVMSACWLFVFFLVIAVWGLGLIRRLVMGEKPQAPNLIVPAIGLMSLLWFLLIAALWGAVLKLPGGFNLGVPEDVVAASLNTISAALIVLVLLGAAALVVLGRKGELKRGDFTNPEVYMADNGAKAAEYANRYRLLIASGLLRALWTFLPLVLAITFVVFLPFARDLQRVLAELTIPVIFGILAIGSFLIYTLKAEFAAGLGILADVLAYLNNASWKGDDPRSPTWLERLPLVGAADAASKNPRGYWLRRRIHDRLEVLIRGLIRDEKPGRLDIVSHSQGTIIAIDLIAMSGRNWMAELRNGGIEARMRLVTMGSPYTHLYGYYFPSSFPPVSGRPTLLPGKGGVLDAWLNIFRIDDFVGTHIGKGNWPAEFPVPPNGHTNYWIDRRVVAKLRDFLK